MSQLGLDALLRPKAIAVIGASANPQRAGFLIIKNLLSSGFNGPVMPVNPKYKAVSGILTYPDIASLPLQPDLAVLCTHPKRHLALLQALGDKGCSAVIILSSIPQQQEELKACAEQYGIRLLGPNSLGLLAPWQKLNASFSPVPMLPGKLAFISQSAAVANTILDWAQQRKIGFSYFISLGDCLDIDFDEILDFLARDSKTTAILLYMERLNHTRRFLSASRSASRNKPIVAIKSGRSQQAQQLLNGQCGLDSAYDAALQRAGILRVQDTHELFSAVETLSHMPTLRGEKLMIISNGAAPAAMALDQLYAQNGRLVTLDDSYLVQLREKLPNDIKINNPLDLRDAATAEDYQSALHILLNNQECDAILLIHSPSAMAPATKTAELIINTIKQHPRGKRVAILTNWCGEHSSQEARHLFTDASLPTYRTPEGAISAFMHMVEYRRTQKQLMETPVLLPRSKEESLKARTLIKQALNEHRTQLSSHETQSLLNAYDINILPSWLVADSAEAVHIAEKIGYPVALKLSSPDIPHKSDVQGVMLYQRNPTEVQLATTDILARVRQNYPEAHINGLLVQSMAERAGTQELRISATVDPTLGPIILLGENSLSWDPEQDAVATLPPLNMTLARYLVLQALKNGKIRSQHSSVPLDIESISQLLVKISDLIIECPEVIQLDIHPILALGSDFTLLDAHIQIDYTTDVSHSRLAIRPYPKELEQEITLKNGLNCLVRPILPEDEPSLKNFISRVTKEDLYYRYFSEVSEFTHEDLANMTQIDYDREMAFVAILIQQDANEIIGVTRILAEPDNNSAEFSILIRSDLKRLGLGRMLLEKMFNYAKQQKVRKLTGITMPHNQGMLTLAKELGFSIDLQLEDGIVNLELALDK